MEIGKYKPLDRGNLEASVYKHMYTEVYIDASTQTSQQRG